MGHLQNFLRWARGQGVKMHGIKPCKIPGRGIGVIATRRIKAGEDILTAPHEALRSLYTVSTSVREKLPPETSIHALLAADFAVDKVDELAPWTAVLPSSDDLEISMPFMWPEALQDLLPTYLKSNLKNQITKFSNHWEAFTKVFPSVPKKSYLYPWLIINTRSFCHDTPETMKYPWEDRLALIPVADLFNHADVGCKVTYSPEEYAVTTERAYDKDEEIFISYGRHANDYILLEYGFVSDTNRWDEVYIDDVILPKLSESQKVDLEKREMLGKYPLRSSSKEFRRTQAVLRLLSCTIGQFELYLDNKETDVDLQRCVNVFMVGLLDEFLNLIRETLRAIDELQVGQEAQRTMLTKRWLQIERSVNQVMEGYQHRQVNEKR